MAWLPAIPLAGRFRRRQTATAGVRYLRGALTVPRSALTAGCLWVLAAGSPALAVAAPPVLAAAAAPSTAAALDRPAGGWQWPLPAPRVILRRFSPPPMPYAAGHRGVDLGAPVGTPVRAAGAGVVGYAAPLAGRGVVTVVHGALRTTYEPVTATVRAGDRVGAGTQIGWLAAPTGHCGPGRPCLHWGLLRCDTYLDPLLLVGAARIRLLPLLGTGAAAGAGHGVTGPDRDPPGVLATPAAAESAPDGWRPDAGTARAARDRSVSGREPPLASSGSEARVHREQFQPDPPRRDVAGGGDAGVARLLALAVALVPVAAAGLMLLRRGR